jgi:hypothetical protein
MAGFDERINDRPGPEIPIFPISTGLPSTTVFSAEGVTVNETRLLSRSTSK